MDSNTYLDKLGVIQLLKKVSASIKNHTSNKIIRKEVEDLDTGEITIGEAENPNNFTTVNAVVDYLKNRKKITINQQSVVETSEGFNVSDNISSYNGEQIAQINIKLASSSDIDKLF